MHELYTYSHVPCLEVEVAVLVVLESYSDKEMFLQCLMLYVLAGLRAIFLVLLSLSHCLL